MAKPFQAEFSTRIRAAEILSTIVDTACPGLQAAFDEAMSGSHFAARDRAFIRKLITTTLRHLRTIDREIGQYWNKAPKDLFGKNAIRIGAAQIMYLGTPAHAAVFETVACLKARRPRLAGLANAVLRKLSSTTPTEPAAIGPDWLIKSWHRRFGKIAGDAIDRAHEREPPIDLVFSNDATAWSNEHGGLLLSRQIVRIEKADPIETLPGYEQGQFWVQDLAATLPVRIMAPKPDERILDLCAAPGGKTAQLCAAGANVVAIEKDRGRLQRLNQNMQRLGFDPDIRKIDMLDLDSNEKFDAVLLDAPCSATGTIRRHPDIMWRRRQSDLPQLASLQLQLLIKAADFLKPGGRLIYAVCSLQTEEGPDLLRHYLEQNNAALSPLAINPRLDHPLIKSSLNDAALNWQCQTLPHMLAEQGGADGFFIAQLVKPL